MSISRVLLFTVALVLALALMVSASSDSLSSNRADLPKMVQILNRHQAKPKAQPKKAQPKKAQPKGRRISSFLLPGQYCPVSFAAPSAATAALAAKGYKQASKKSGRKAARFLQQQPSAGTGVPPLTEAQIALCKQQQAGAAAAAPAPRGQGKGGKLFTSLVDGKTNDQIWNPAVSEKVKSAVNDFRKKKKLPNGQIYGASVRSLSLVGKTEAQVTSELKKFKCVKDNQVMKNVTNNQPIVFNGKTIPMPVFICPDGGAIRLKPMGDPTSKFRSQPHGVKALRYPFNSPFVTFDDEVIKVDAKGNPLPKWMKDLITAFPTSQPDQNDFADAWADRAHQNLKA